MTLEEEQTRCQGMFDSSDFPLLQDESSQQAAEYFRLAVQQVNRCGTPLIPLNYALFYFYVSGRHQLLNEKMDAMLADGAEWYHDDAAKLFLRYLTPCNDLSMADLQQDLLSVVSGIIESAGNAGQSVDQHSDSLDRKATKLARCQDPKQARQVAIEILDETRSLVKESKALASDMQASVQEVEKLQEELLHARREASVDALTGLQNRRAFDLVLAELVAKDEPFALIIIDVDNFKETNDQHGHLIGDRVLCHLAKLLSASTRTTDTVTRYGGEEFAILLPKTRLGGAERVAEKLRSALARVTMRRTDTGGSLGKITASFGVAEHLRQESGHETLARADAALYTAKRNGRNRVEIADQSLETPAIRHSA